MITSEAKQTKSSKLEQHFNQFRQHIIGIDQEFDSPFGDKRLFTQIGRLLDVCIALLKKKSVMNLDLL